MTTNEAYILAIYIRTLGSSLIKPCMMGDSDNESCAVGTMGWHLNTLSIGSEVTLGLLYDKTISHKLDFHETMCFYQCPCCCLNID